MSPEESTHVENAFTGTTSSFSRTAFGKVAVGAVLRQRVFAEHPWPDAAERSLAIGWGHAAHWGAPHVGYFLGHAVFYYDSFGMQRRMDYVAENIADPPAMSQSISLALPAPRIGDGVRQSGKEQRRGDPQWQGEQRPVADQPLGEQHCAQAGN